MRKNEEDQGARLVRYMLGVLLGGGVALSVCFLLLLLASVGISRGLFSQDHMDQITMVACVAGSFLGGVTAVGRCGARALIVGLLAGAVFFLLLLTAGVIVFHASVPESGGIGLLCGSLLGGAAAGLLAGRTKRGKGKRTAAKRKRRS